PAAPRGPEPRQPEAPRAFRPPRGLRRRARCDAPGSGGRLDTSRSRRPPREQQTPPGEQREHLRGALLDRVAVGVNDQVRTHRRLIRVAHAGEVRELTAERLLVEALHVALDERVEGRLGVYLEEGDSFLVG